MRCLLIVCVLWLSGCAALIPPELPLKVALLAPFEGRYREVGYSALYPARLALADSGVETVQLLAVDDGGSVETAIQRARALVDDPAVRVVIVQGYSATHVDVLAALDGLPVIVVGDWGASPAPNVYHMTHPAIAESVVDPRLSVTDSAQMAAPFIGGEVAALEGFRALRGDDLDGVTILTSGAIPDEAFRARVLSSDMFAAEPNHLSVLTYDAARFAVESLRSGTSLDALRHDGMSGLITFTAGYWDDAPLNRLIYRDGVLVDDAVE